MPDAPAMLVVPPAEDVPVEVEVPPVLDVPAELEAPPVLAVFPPVAPVLPPVADAPATAFAPPVSAVVMLPSSSPPQDTARKTSTRSDAGLFRIFFTKSTSASH